jgi:hypothetical protein
MKTKSTLGGNEGQGPNLPLKSPAKRKMDHPQKQQGQHGPPSAATKLSNNVNLSHIEEPLNNGIPPHIVPNKTHITQNLKKPEISS